MSTPVAGEQMESVVPETSEDGVSGDRSPWRESMDRILTGLVLGAVTLNFLALNYILPLIGLMLLLLGFRTLRRVNGWFRACWMIMVLRLAAFVPVLILNATVYRNQVSGAFPGTVLSFSGPLLQILLLFSLWKAVAEVREESGAAGSAGGAGGLLVWTVAMFLLALVQISSLILWILMVLLYIVAIRSLYRFSVAVEDNGHAPGGAQTRIPDRSLTMSIMAVLLAGILGGSYFFGSYPMDWTVQKHVRTPETMESEKTLLNLGYPEEALKDLSEGDLLAVGDALQVVVVDHQKAAGNTAGTVRVLPELHLRSVAVEIPGERPQWRIFHHFFWRDKPGSAGTEAIRIWPAYRESEGWAVAGEMTGQVLYENEGMVYTAPFHSLSGECYPYDTMLWGVQETQDILAEFSLPGNGERHRGYVAYGVEEIREGWIINSWVNYTHQMSRLQYPMVTAGEKSRAPGWNDGYPFITVQEALQFFVMEDSIDLLSGEN